MEKFLNVQNVNDYARYVGAEELHPLVSVIHYDEPEACRHSLNRYGVYGIFLMDRAKSLLQEGRSVSETAEALGFDYPQHFTRVFKKHFGAAPSRLILFLTASPPCRDCRRPRSRRECL